MRIAILPSQINMLPLLLTDPDIVIEKVLHTCDSRPQMKTDASKICKEFREMGPDCGIEGLIRALLQRDGLGHLASGLFPICKCKFPDAGIMLYHVCLCTF